MARFRITSLIVLVAIVAAGLAAMRVASELVVQGVATLMMLIMLLGITGALARRTGAWIGFSAFSCGYLIFVTLSNITTLDLSGVAIELVADRLHPTHPEKPSPPKVNRVYLDGVRDRDQAILNADFDVENPSLNASERLAMRAYQDRLRDYNERRDQACLRNGYAATIGSLFVALTLGWVGGIAGRFLETPRSCTSAERAAAI